MSRKGFLVGHLGCSISTGLVMAIIVFYIWYPTPLATALGISTIFLILLLVDVVIGPLLTFIVYKEGKKSLRFDLSVIVSIQIAALVYGVFIIAQGRPIWIVFNVDRFDVVQSYQLSAEHLGNAKDDFRSSNWLGPKWVAATRPTDESIDSDLMFESLAGGADLPQRPDLYVPYKDEIGNISRKAISIVELKKFNIPIKVSAMLKSYPEADAYLPLVGKKKNMTVLIKRATADIEGIVELNPW